MDRLLALGVLVCMCVGCAFMPLPDTPRTWYDERWGGVTEQELDNSCGLASLRTVMHHHFMEDVTERALIQRYLETQSEQVIARAMKDGLSLLELEQLARSFGYEVRRSMYSYDELRRVTEFMPVVVYLEVGRFKHFAVVRGMSESEVLLADSSRGNVRYTRDVFLREWKVPNVLKGEWNHPGGLVLFSKKDTPSVGTVLRHPQRGVPTSFHTLRRAMILKQ